jgi:hypothetical protein
MKYEDHPIANLFPLLSDLEQKELVNSIQANGQRLPVTIYQGKILDGRNRYRACQILGIQPQIEEPEIADPFEFVLDRNVRHRHLTTGQRARIASKMATMKQGGERKSDQNSINGVLNHVVLGVSKAAAIMHVSASSVGYVRQMEKDRPDLIPALETGRVSPTIMQKGSRAQQNGKALAKKHGYSLSADGSFIPPGKTEADRQTAIHKLNQERQKTDQQFAEAEKEARGLVIKRPKAKGKFDQPIRTRFAYIRQQLRNLITTYFRKSEYAEVCQLITEHFVKDKTSCQQNPNDLKGINNVS